MNIYFFYLLLKKAFTDKNNLIITEFVQINTTYFNNINVSSIGFINVIFFKNSLTILAK